MDDKRYNLYQMIQIDLGGVTEDLQKVNVLIKQCNFDENTKQTLAKIHQIYDFTAKELAILISKTAQLIFNNP